MKSSRVKVLIVVKVIEVPRGGFKFLKNTLNKSVEDATELAFNYYYLLFESLRIDFDAAFHMHRIDLFDSGGACEIRRLSQALLFYPVPMSNSRRIHRRLE